MILLGCYHKGGPAEYIMLKENGVEALASVLKIAAILCYLVTIISSFYDHLQTLKVVAVSSTYYVRYIEVH